MPLSVPEVVEETSTVAEQYGNDVELELVQQPRRQVLLDRLGAAPDLHVLFARGVPRPFECALDPVGDEVKRGPTLHLERIAPVMGEDEDVVVVRRGVSPPALPPGGAPPAPPPGGA